MASSKNYPILPVSRVHPKCSCLLDSELTSDSHRSWHTIYTLPSTTRDTYVRLNWFKNNVRHSSGRNSKFLFRQLTRCRTRTNTFQKLNGFCEGLYTLIITGGQCGGTQDRRFFENDDTITNPTNTVMEPALRANPPYRRGLIPGRGDLGRRRVWVCVFMTETNNNWTVCVVALGGGRRKAGGEWKTNNVIYFWTVAVLTQSSAGKRSSAVRLNDVFFILFLYTVRV